MCESAKTTRLLTKATEESICEWHQHHTDNKNVIIIKNTGSGFFNTVSYIWNAFEENWYKQEAKSR